MKPIQLILALSLILSLAACKRNKEGVYEVRDDLGYSQKYEYFAVPEDETERIEYLKSYPNSYTLAHFPYESAKDLGYTKKDLVYPQWHNKEGKEIPGANGKFASQAGTGGGAGCDGSGYKGPTSDVNSAVFCQQAWHKIECDGYARNSAEVKQVCDIYKALMRDWVGPGAAPVCSYCD